MKWLDKASLPSEKEKGRAFERLAKAAMRLRIATAWGQQGPYVVVSPRWRRTPRILKKYGVGSLVVFGGRLGRIVGSSPVLKIPCTFGRGG
jgi:hypothetical protein